MSAPVTEVLGGDVALYSVAPSDDYAAARAYALEEALGSVTPSDTTETAAFCGDEAI